MDPVDSFIHSLEFRMKYIRPTRTILTFAAIGGRLAAVGVAALGTGLFLLDVAVVGEGRLADVASSLVERVDGRDLAEFDLFGPESGWCWWI